MTRGIDFEAGGGVWTLRFSFNALCAIEAATGRPAIEVLRSVDTVAADFTLFRTVFQCGLTGKVPAVEVGELIDEIGIRRAGALFGQAIALAMPGETASGEPPAEA